MGTDAMNQTPPLPPGFVLESMPPQASGAAPGYVDPADIVESGGPNFVDPRDVQETAGTPPLPAGFVLEQPNANSQQPDLQAQYEAALAKVRESEFADMPEDEWRRLALGEGRETLPIVGRLPGFAEPYDAMELSQHGALFGLTDELEAGKAAIGAGISQLFGGKGPGMGDVWTDRLALEQARRDLGRQQQGALGTAAEVVGGLASIGPGKASLAAPVVNTFGQSAKNLGQAGLQGAAYGFGATDGDLGQRAAGAGVGAVLSAGVSAVAPSVVRGVQGVVRGVQQGAMTRAAV